MWESIRIIWKLINMINVETDMEALYLQIEEVSNQSKLYQDPSQISPQIVRELKHARSLLQQYLRLSISCIQFYLIPRKFLFKYIYTPCKLFLLKMKL